MNNKKLLKEVSESSSRLIYNSYNLNEFKEKKGSTAQTILNHMDVVIHHKETNNVNLFVRRSFSEHLWSWINDCASRL